MIYNIFYLLLYLASLMAQRLKHLPAMRETWVRSLVREDPLEKEMATHFGILAWRIHGQNPWLAGYSPRGRKESDTTERLHFHFIWIVRIFVSLCIRDANL